MTAMKLQKLLYYSQAWSLVWDDKPLFKARVEAWANGPVVPQVYQQHRGLFKVKDWSKGDRTAISKIESETIDSVLKFYGDKSSQWLSDLSHSEAPWVDARVGFLPGQRCGKEITHAAMAEYYGAL